MKSTTTYYKEIKWKNPPKRRGGVKLGTRKNTSSRIYEILEELKKFPGRWALIGETSACTYHIRYLHDYEVTTRSKTYGIYPVRYMYARYIGK